MRMAVYQQAPACGLWLKNDRNNVSQTEVSEADARQVIDSFYAQGLFFFGGGGGGGGELRAARSVTDSLQAHSVRCPCGM